MTTFRKLQEQEFQYSVKTMDRMDLLSRALRMAITMFIAVFAVGCCAVDSTQIVYNVF